MALILLAILLIGVPLVEIAVFIEVGSGIGVLPTIAATVATALAGSLLLRAQGLAALTRARAQMDQGQLPAREMFEGVCLVLAGALLLLPGFVTDIIGLLLFVPPVREFLRYMIARHIAAKAARGEAHIFVDGVEVTPGKGQSGGPGRVIDGDFHEVEGEAGDRNNPPGPDQRPDQRRIGR